MFGIRDALFGQSSSSEAYANVLEIRHNLRKSTATLKVVDQDGNKSNVTKKSITKVSMAEGTGIPVSSSTATGVVQYGGPPYEDYIIVDVEGSKITLS